MSDSEKLVEDGVKYKPEPLILRPPVGGETFSGTNVGVHRMYSNLLKNRIIIGVIANVMLLVIAVAFMIFFFFLRHSASGFDGSCSVYTVDPDLQLEEHYRYEPRMAVIDHGSVFDSPPVRIFHLLENMLTLIKTHDVCYMHSLQPDVASAIPTDDTILQRIKESSRPNLKIKADLARQIWMMSPEQEDQGLKLQRPVTVANCSSLPIFKLMQMVFSPQHAPPLPSDTDSIPPSMVCPEGCSDEFGVDGLFCRCEAENLSPINSAIIQLRDRLPSKVKLVPEGCSVYTHIIGGALPNEKIHTLPEMTIVKCRHPAK